MSRVIRWLGGEFDLRRPPSDMIRQAKTEHGLRLSVFPRDSDRYVAILHEGSIAGFYTPTETAWGVRFGPIYVDPEYRRLGLCADVYRRWAVEHTVVVFAEHCNVASARAAEAGGLLPWRRTRWGVHYRGGPGS